MGETPVQALCFCFVLNVFVIAEKYKDTYLKGANDGEKDLKEIFKNLSSDMNIFSHIVPGFNPSPNIKSVLAWNDIADSAS